MSVIKEKKGSLWFPITEIKAPTAPEVSYSISVIHHPFSWLKQPEVMRQAKERLEEISDLILTGHEHVAESYQIRERGGDDHEYLEGGVLQESGAPDACTFNVIRLNFQTQTQVTTKYKWSTDGYFEHDQEPAGAPLGRNRNRADQKFRLREKFQKDLDDPELPLQHPQRDLRLSDIFTYPDLRKFEEGGSSEDFERVRSEAVVDVLVAESRVVLTGAEKSGKTSLAKMLFMDMHRAGYVPILLKGSKLGRSGSLEGVRNTLGNLVKDQYQEVSPEQYEQLQLDKKVLILDDLQDAPSHSEKRSEVLDYLGQKFGKVVLIGNDEFCLEEFFAAGKDTAKLVNYRRFDICEFGHVRLETLARKLLRVSRAGTEIDEGKLDDEVRHACGLVEQVLRVNVIPHHPWILIVLLKNADTAEAPAAKNGSYGHLFQAIITFAMNSSKWKKLDIKGKYTYLGNLAHELYTRKSATMTEDDARAFHRAHCDRIGVEIDFEPLRDDLVQIGLLRFDGERLAFRTKYSYCFFVAWYLSKHIHKQEIKDEIRRLSSQLYHEQSANIVVFLAHLTNDPVVLDEMKRTAAGLFEKAPLANLKEDVESLNALDGTALQFVLPPSSPDENRRQQQEATDERLARRNPREVDGRHINHPGDGGAQAEQDERERYLHEIQAALRTIQILGQVLRNGAGDIEADTKLAIAEEIFRLGRRLLGFLYDLLPDDLPGWCSHLAEQYRKDNPDADKEEVAGAVRRQIFGLCWFATFRVIKHVSESVGMDLLSGTFRKLLERDSATANQIIDLSIRLDRPGKLPKDEAIDLYEELAKNHFAQTVVKSLVMHHLYLYNVKIADKQSICKQMDIKISKKSMDPNQKRFGGKA